MPFPIDDTTPDDYWTWQNDDDEDVSIDRVFLQFRTIDVALAYGRENRRRQPADALELWNTLSKEEKLKHVRSARMTALSMVNFDDIFEKAAFTLRWPDPAEKPEAESPAIYLRGGKRVALQMSESLEDWYIPCNPRNRNLFAEGPWQDWVSLARKILEAEEVRLKTPPEDREE